MTCDSLPEIITKHIVLSLVTQIFDPLGLIGPVTIKAKILLQSLWQLKVAWHPATRDVQNYMVILLSITIGH